MCKACQEAVGKNTWSMDNDEVGITGDEWSRGGRLNEMREPVVGLPGAYRQNPDLEFY